jgi:hypothetical protein
MGLFDDTSFSRLHALINDLIPCFYRLILQIRINVFFPQLEMFLLYRSICRWPHVLFGQLFAKTWGFFCTIKTRNADSDDTLTGPRNMHQRVSFARTLMPGCKVVLQVW